MTQSNSDAVPVHLGLILDGNRRWAREHGLPTLEGHRRGYSNLKDIGKEAVNRGVKYISAYIFSTENWHRAPAEVKYLMDLAYHLIKDDLDELNREGIRVKWLGTTEGLRDKLVRAIRHAEETTKDNVRGTLCLCFNYGGHQEIADAAQALVDAGETTITVQKLADHLYGGPEIPPVDLVIRTSGEQRLSNFMLWRSAYAEFRFIDKHWPAFTRDDLAEALDDYASRGRRFGK